MRKTILPCILITCSLNVTNVLAQATVPSNIRASLALESLSARSVLQPNDIGVYGIDLPPGSVVGNPYLNESWQLTRILLYDNNKLVDNVNSRLDLYNYGFEIKANSTLVFVKGDLIKSFIYQNKEDNSSKLYINTKEFKSLSFEQPGFFEVLCEGNVQLLKLSKVRIKKPDYNIALNAGSRDTKIYKDDTLYLVTNNAIHKLPRTPAKIVKSLRSYGFPDELTSRDVNSENNLKSVIDSFNMKQ
jgi:hypothetical protein